MFIATTIKQDDIQVKHKMSVYTDTLYEAELYVQAFFAEAYGTEAIELYYMDGMLYSLFVRGEFEASVEIRMID